MLVLDQKLVLEYMLLVLILAISLVLLVLLDHMLNIQDLLLLASELVWLFPASFWVGKPAFAHMLA